jgi:hypothetical protein
VIIEFLVYDVDGVYQNLAEAGHRRRLIPVPRPTFATCKLVISLKEALNVYFTWRTRAS